MMDEQIKNLFAGLEIPAPSANFENKIIAQSHHVKKQRQFGGYAAIAAIVIFIVSLSAQNFSSVNKPAEVAKDIISSQSSEYANLVDDKAIINEDDIYDGLI